MTLAVLGVVLIFASLLIAGVSDQIQTWAYRDKLREEPVIVKMRHWCWFISMAAFWAGWIIILKGAK